jgi:D-galactarolactone cycloisomerase
MRPSGASRDDTKEAGTVKITGVEVFPLVHTLDVPRGDGRGLSTWRQTLIAKITSDEGVHGWGQGGRLETVRDVLAPLLVGQDPRETGRLWHRLFQASRGDRWSVGAVDVALWDLKGRLTGMSVAQLLGGALRETVPAYASLHNYTPAPDLSDELAAAIREAKARGFGALKLKIGGRPLAEDLRYVRLAREVAGPDLDLIADANETYTIPNAVKVGRVLEELDYAWFEEPIPTHDVAGYAQLCQVLDIAVAGYEGVGDPQRIAPVLQSKAIDLYQPDVVGSGGFTVIPHLAALASAFGVGFTCHVWDSALVQVASLHFLATLPPWQAYSMRPIPPPLEVTTLPRQPLNADLLLDPPALQPDGTFALPAGPGLGVEVNPETLEKYALSR